MKKLHSRVKARRLAHNSLEYKRLSLDANCCCTMCPANRGENSRGKHPKRGKKMAVKHYYATGKGRKIRHKRCSFFYEELLAKYPDKKDRP